LSKVIVFCIDGATFPLVKMLAMESAFMNVLYTTKRMGPLEVPLPASTSTGFPTFFTGKNLGKLGALSEHDLKNEPMFSTDYVQRTFLNGLSAVKGDALWDILDKEGMKTISFNVPVTYPAKEIDGIMISSFDTTGNAWSQPLDFAKELSDYWKPNDEITSTNDGDTARFWEDRLGKEINIASNLINEFEWDLALITFLQLDRIKHKVMGRYYSQYSARVLLERMYIKVFKAVVEVLQSAYNKYGIENVEFFIMSDHGFHITEKHFSINSFLYNKGWLKVNENADALIKNYPDAISTKAIDMEKTKVWTSGQGLVTINDHRFAGVVDDPDFVDEVKIALEGYQDPLSEINPIMEIRTKDEEWSGNINFMPDLICVPTMGFDIHTPNISRHVIIRNKPRENSPEGSYHYHNNGFYATSYRSTGQKSAHLLDLPPTILEALDVKIPKDFDGVPLPKSL